jgi:polar amino acid transport system permease protein
MNDVSAWFKWLSHTSGIKLTIFYDSYDRSRWFTGLVNTLELSAICLVLSLLLGACVAWWNRSRFALVRYLVGSYVQLFRNTPPLAQIYFFYFAISPLLPKVGGQPLLGSMGWAIVSLTLLETAFTSEIFRAGIEAVPKSMIEAAESLGYSKLQIFIDIVLPLAFRFTLPAINNNLVNLVKTTTLAYAIAAPELLYMSSQIWSEQTNVADMMCMLLLTYVAIIAVINVVMRSLERRLRIPGFGQ